MNLGRILSGMMLPLLVSASWGAVVSDGSLGLGSVGNTAGNYLIPASAGLLKGNNLFHSFSEFNLTSGQSATFDGLGGVQNVLARVTSGARSSVDGRISCGANLFLINPSGISFGPNAILDVTGSFNVSSADYLKLSDGPRFNAVATFGEKDTLTAMPVSSFGFLSTAPASINFTGSQLVAQSGKEINVVAGDISLDGASLTAPSGSIGLVSVAAAGVVPVGTSEVAKLPEAIVPKMGTISIKNTSKVDVSVEAGSNGGGRLVIRGGKLQMLPQAGTDEKPYSYANASKLLANHDGSGKAADIDIRTTESVSLQDGIVESKIRGSGFGGLINIESPSLYFTYDGPANLQDHGGGGIFAEAYGLGRGPDISLRGADLYMSNYFISSTTLYKGALGSALDALAGNISLTIDTIYIDGYNSGVSDTAHGSGSAGDINIRAKSFALGGFFNDINGGSFPNVSGKGGLVSIHAADISVGGFGGIYTVTAGSGPAGEIDLVGDRIDVTDGYVWSITRSTGAAGRISVNAGNLIVGGYGQISASSEGGGNGGNVFVTAKTATIGALDIYGANTAAIKADALTSSGNAGTVHVDVSGLLRIDGRFGTNANDGVGISVNQKEGTTGAAGAVSVIAGNVELFGSPFGNAGIFAKSATTQKAGEITLSTPNLLLENRALISSANTFSGLVGSGNAGSVQIDVSGKVKMGGGSVITTAATQGDAGVVHLNAGVSLALDGQSSISASANKGIGGNIELIAKDRIDIRYSEVIATASLHGGNVSIDPHFVFVDHSVISALGLGGGEAGNLVIQSDFFFSSESRVFATGQLRIEAVDANLANAIGTLNGQLAAPSGQLQERCAMRLGGNVSSFLAVGRGGTASEASELFGESAVWDKRRLR